MTFHIKSFYELSNTELYCILKLRNAVFIVEQNCPYQDLDDNDQSAFHILGFSEDTLIAYSRILPPGNLYSQPSIGRVLIHSAYRKQELGKELMKFNINKTLELFNNQGIIISAQQYLLRFYNDLGFVEEGDVYLEDGIPHLKMKYKQKNIFNLPFDLV